MNIPDNSKFQKLIKNRPSLSILPSVNKRILAQYHARSGFVNVGLTLFLSVLTYKFYLNLNSAPFIKTRKSFSFQSDPYSGKVKCNYQDVPNHQYGY